MKDMLLLIILCGYAVWGYRLMGRLDRFLNGHVKNEDEDQQLHDG